MMLAVLIHAYCQGRRSSRKISKAYEEKFPYRWLTGNTVPDHCVISRFRSHHEGLMKTVFCEILSACAEDEEEDRRFGPTRRGDELPENMEDQASRPTRLKEAKAQPQAKRSGGCCPA